jgi:L-alanine-DL-glutamate epimerase-like enolase superfamily enzyme
VLTDDEVVGHSVVFTYTTAALKPTADLIRNLEDLVQGEPLAAVELEQKLSWLEYADWWNPILEGPLKTQDGMAVVGVAIGTGVGWDEKAVDRYTV